MAKGLLIIKTLTPTHPGAGTSLGAIDLMLQREVTTNFPFIQGSSLKGAIRSHLESQPVDDNLARNLINFAKDNGDDELKKEVENLTPDKLTIFRVRLLVQKLKKLNKDVKDFEQLYKKLDTVFGPYEAGGELKKSSLTITDASLLFYPVRTLKGLYALVTCPEILRRLNMPHIDLKVPDSLLNLDNKGTVKALKSTKSHYEINGKVYFEDLNFSVENLQDNDLNWTNEKLGLDEGIKNRLFIVHDDVFQYFVEFATQVMSRNRINYETGIVEKGALWTEEHLPPETYLFSYLEDDGKVISKIKKDESKDSKDATPFEWITDRLNDKVIHLGGDETVGKGFVQLKFKDLSEGGNG